MALYSRRDFLQMGASLAAALSLGPAAGPALADGLQKIFTRQKRVLWLQGLACTGCSVSFLDSDHPGPLEILTQVISLGYHPNISATQGTQALETIQQITRDEEFVLIFEGAVASKMEEACLIGGKPMSGLLAEAMQRAKLVIAAGTCAAFGGIPAAEGNVTGAVSVGEFMRSKGIPVERRLVNCPGCPMHADSLLATITYAVGQGYPKVDAALLTPDIIYKHSVHDDCPRFHYWQKSQFAEKFGEDGCLFKLGCLGPLSRTNCPQRQWNGGVNWCVRAGAPCIACTSPDFARKAAFPFYRKGEQYHSVSYQDRDRQGDKTRQTDQDPKGIKK